MSVEEDENLHSANELLGQVNYLNIQFLKLVFSFQEESELFNINYSSIIIHIQKLNTCMIIHMVNIE